MNHEGIEMLRALLERTAPKPEPEPEHKPLRFCRRRTDPADRALMQFAYGNRERCTN